MKKFNHVTLEKLNIISENINAVESDGKRFYSTPTGVKYPSVTTVTGFKKKKFFAEWRKNNPVESKRVLRRGNDFHKIVESYLNNNGTPPKEDLLNYSLFKQFEPLLDNIDNIHLQETAMYSDLIKLAKHFSLNDGKKIIKNVISVIGRPLIKTEIDETINFIKKLDPSLLAPLYQAKTIKIVVDTLVDEFKSFKCNNPQYSNIQQNLRETIGKTSEQDTVYSIYDNPTPSKNNTVSPSKNNTVSPSTTTMQPSNIYSC